MCTHLSNFIHISHLPPIQAARKGKMILPAAFSAVVKGDRLSLPQERNIISLQG